MWRTRPPQWSMREACPDPRLSLHRGAQIRTGDLSDPNGARYQAAPHPEAARRLATLVTMRSESSRYVVYIDNQGGIRLNVVTLIGNLATDVEVKDVGDKQVAKFLLA